MVDTVGWTNWSWGEVVHRDHALLDRRISQ